jgi:hypothetical protein
MIAQKNALEWTTSLEPGLSVCNSYFRKTQSGYALVDMVWTRKPWKRFSHGNGNPR